MKIARRTFRVEVPSVAMGDIAFNLLIFFVILAKAQDDSHVKWIPATAPKLEAVKHARVKVAVDVNNKVYLNGHEIPLEALSKRIEEMLGSVAAEDRVVLLKIHKEAMAQTFEPIIEAVSEAGGKMVHILQDKNETAAPSG